MVTQKSRKSRKDLKVRWKSRKFPLRFLSAARAKGTFCDFCEFLCDKKTLNHTTPAPMQLINEFFIGLKIIFLG